jgi:hypothetical protein
VAAVERSGVVMVLDRHGVHGEPMRWLSEGVELVEIATGTFAVVQHPTECKPFAHVERATLEEAVDE